MIPILLSAVLALPCAPAGEDPPFAITEELVQELGGRARAAVEAALELDLTEYARFELADPRDVKAALDLELEPQFRMQFEDPEEAERNREQFSSTISAGLLAKYSYGERAVLVVPATFERMATLLDEPELLTEGAVYAVLLHEAVHAAQDRLYGWGESLSRLKTTGELLAFNAVAEGHAQYIAHSLCSESPWSEGFAAFSRCIGALPKDMSEARRNMARVVSANLTTAYYDGEDFIRAIEAAGGQEAVDRAFREPPGSIDVIFHPAWFLDPASRPANRYDLKRGFAPLIERYPEGDWAHSELELQRPQIEAAMSVLPKEETSAAIDRLRSAWIHVVADNEESGHLILPVLMEFGSPDEAAAFLEVEERGMRKKDEVMAKGEIRITSAEYRDVRRGSHQGVLAKKTIVAMNQTIETKTAVLVHGPLLLELSLQGIEMDDEDLVDLGIALLDATLQPVEVEIAADPEDQPAEER